MNNRDFRQAYRYQQRQERNEQRRVIREYRYYEKLMKEEMKKYYEENYSIPTPEEIQKYKQENNIT